MVLALLVPQYAFSLGLGEARVESFLHQPLDVRMRVLDFSAAELDSLSVRIANPSDFDRLGLMSAALGLDLRVTLDRSVSPPQVQIVSNRPVGDPVVQLLVDARWANGRMLREYTLFLDPPAVEMRPPSRPQPERTEAAESTAGPPQAAAPRPAPPASTPRAAPRSATRPEIADRYGPVADGETLWSIARQALPAADISVNQMMLAIVDLNPRAFRDGNINQLLRGAQLRIPTEAQARAFDTQTADATAAAQHRAFREGRTTQPRRVSDAGRGNVDDSRMPPARPERESPDAPATDPGEREQARLSLVPPDESEGGSGLSESAEQIDDLRQRLARAEEELYAARAEAREFSNRVDELEQAINRGADNGLGLRDAELAQLEQALREAREALEVEDDSQRRSDISSRIDQLLGDAQTRQEAESAAEAEPQPQSGPEPAVQPPAGEPEPQADRGGALGMLGNPIVLTGLIVVLVLLLVAVTYILVRRQRQNVEPEKPAAKSGPKLSSATGMGTEVLPHTQVEKHPTSLAAHLALVQQLAADEDREALGAALEEMFVHVDTGDEPEWQQAVEVAGRIIPGHALVKGSADAASSGAPGQEPSEVSEDVDDEVLAEPHEDDVDELMSRLDEDLDESEEMDWLEQESGDDADRPSEPLLREDAEEDYGDPAIGMPDEDEDADVDLGASASGSEQPHHASDPDHKPDPKSVPKDAGSDEPESDKEFLLDWPHEGGADTAEAGEAEQQQGMGDDDDIFASGDDDAEVKLDLARAYLSWNSAESARTLLEEVAREGNQEQQAEARRLLDGLSDGASDDE